MNSSAKQVSEKSTKRYHPDNPAGPLELLTHLFHDLGIQSNVLVCAEYTRHNQLLTSRKVLKALAKVVNDQPSLSIIGVSQPSEKKVGNHGLWEARLPAIRIQDCVEFTNTQADVDLVQVFENAHNNWFDTKDTSKPWWKLLVINGRYAVFIYHHSIGDGLSGYAFHRSFLAALNSNEVTSSPTSGVTEEGTFITHEPLKMPTPSPFDQIDENISWLYIIYNFLYWTALRFFVSQEYFLFSDATYSKAYPTLAKPFPIAERTHTKVEALRIDSATMGKCLSECRKHSTSFTALLQTIIQVTLAADIYPKAKFGFSRLAVNIRPLLKSDPGRDVFTNAVGTYYRTQPLGRYRVCANHPSPPGSASTQAIFIDVPTVWKLAKAYKQDLNHYIYQSRAVVRDFLFCKIMDVDIEDFSFYGHGLFMNNSFLISNLGVFEPQNDMSDGGWSIKDIGFSASAIRAALGDIGIVFNVASAKGGDCLISATYEEGVLRDEMVKKVLRAVLARLKLLI
jgi:hypothetical protein